ncbi:MAG: phosphatase [Desulfuromonas sp.]|nr:MAG: phosphatase [Desulfuromonas sp.]
MERFVDLHLHSTCSDGVYSPEEVVRLSVESGLAAIALADHDSIAGVESACEAGAKLGIEVLTGVELSVVWNQWHDIHLLGYGFDPRHAALGEALEEFRAHRETRNEKIVANINLRLQDEGLELIEFARVAALAEGALGRPHIARALMEMGHAIDMEDAFRRYLRPCNVEKWAFPVEQAIALIHHAGGVAVLAHPPFITPRRSRLERLIRSFAEMGLDGIEIYNSGTGDDQFPWYLNLARSLGLIVTGGSDFHGIEGNHERLGYVRCTQRIPYSCVEEIRRCLEMRS